MFRFLSFLAILLIQNTLITECFATPQEIKDPNLQILSHFVQQPINKIDFVKTELLIEHIIDPRIDQSHTQEELDNWVQRIRERIPANASHMIKLLVLNSTLYQSGPWNSYHPFSFDFSDPLGDKLENKLLTHYLETRKGNCVSMPMLYVILGQKLELDITFATAPLHVFAKFRNDDRRWINMETTSGGSKSNESYIKELDIRPRALETGLYLRPLTKKESLSILINILEEYYRAYRSPESQLALTEIGYNINHLDVVSILMRGGAYYRLLKLEPISKSF